MAQPRPPRTWTGRTTSSTPPATSSAAAAAPAPATTPDAGHEHERPSEGLPLHDVGPPELPELPDPFADEDPWKRTSRRSTPKATGTPKAASEKAQPSERRHVDYRMDPAPVWGGELPEKNYKDYHRKLRLWMVEAEARIPANLIGKRIIDSVPLGSKLSALLGHLTVDEICADDGHRTIVKIIEEAHEYLRDQSLEQAFDDAIFKGRRDRGTSMTSFLTGKKAAFAELKKQGLDLLETAAGRHLLGHLILRQGAFTQDQRQRLKVVTNGSIDYKEIEIAIQKVFGDKLDDQGDQHGHGHAPRRWRSAKALMMSLGRMEMGLKHMPCLAVTTVRMMTSSRTSCA